MKKILGLILGVLLLTTTAHATGSVSAKEISLKVGGVLVNAYDLTIGSAEYTDAVDVTGNQGFGVLIATADASGDIDISVEYSIDGTNWYTGYETADPMDGTITADGNIITALSNQTRYIQFPTRLANMIRFKLDPDANTTLTASFVFLK